MIYRSVVQKDGTILIPRNLLRQLGWEVGDELNLEVKDGVLYISKKDKDAPKPKKSRKRKVHTIKVTTENKSSE